MVRKKKKKRRRRRRKKKNKEEPKTEGPEEDDEKLEERTNRKNLTKTSEKLKLTDVGERHHSEKVADVKKREREN
jgi:hypothetical protein